MAMPADKQALDRLVSGHLAEALQFAVRLTGDLDSAEDVVGESLLRVAKSWRSFRGEAQFRTWLFRIVINVFRDRVASRRTTEELPENVADERAADPAEEAMAGELGRLIADRVSSLPPRQREVLVLVAYEGLSTADAAEVLGISQSNVYATLHLARSRLRRQLAAFAEEN